MKDKNWIKLLAVLAVVSMGMSTVMAMPWQFYFTQPGNEDIEFPGMDNETIAEMQEMYEQVQAALEAGNYTQWREAMEGLLTEERFQMHVEFHNAQEERHELMEQLRTAWEEGDYETIAELRGHTWECNNTTECNTTIECNNTTVNATAFPQGLAKGREKNLNRTPPGLNHTPPGLNHTPPGLEISQGNAWGRVKQAFGKLAFWRR
ncbi:MAG: hypothetical protein GOV00_03570 [Candidatus Altiarchaeota archaeon]|nr:hypothetical protein [Candidatus Altiarchaeota archaeon]